MFNIVWNKFKDYNGKKYLKLNRIKLKKKSRLNFKILVFGFIICGLRGNLEIMGLIMIELIVFLGNGKIIFFRNIIFKELLKYFIFYY